MRLRLQDKLAIALTVAGSQRKLADLVGVSHQRIGRWLTIGGVDSWGRPSKAQEPADKEIRRAIDIAFSILSDVAKQQTEAAGLRFNEKIPVVWQRPGINLLDGRQGDRAVIPHAHYLRPALRDSLIRYAYQSRQFISATVRSILDLAKYNAIRRAYVPPPGTIEADMRSQLRAREELFRQDHPNIIAPIAPQQLYLPAQPLNPRFDIDGIIGRINADLRQRHEPASGQGPKTTLADSLVFQMSPDIADVRDVHRELAKVYRERLKQQRKGKK